MVLIPVTGHMFVVYSYNFLLSLRFHISFALPTLTVHGSLTSGSKSLFLKTGLLAVLTCIGLCRVPLFFIRRYENISRHPRRFPAFQT